MPIRAGFHTEGNDYLILHAFIAKLLGLQEAEIDIDFIDSPGRGWQFVMKFIPDVLKRFYAQCATFAVIGVDNDGNIDLDQTGIPEDPAHPRHDRHSGQALVACRHCCILKVVEQIRPDLHWIPKKPGTTWPILVAVPVEMIETWLLILRGSPNIHRRPRSIQKRLLYGRPEATKADVIKIALPLVRSMSAEVLQNLLAFSPSFQDFYKQVHAARPAILENVGCW